MSNTDFLKNKTDEEMEKLTEELSKRFELAQFALFFTLAKRYEWDRFEKDIESKALIETISMAFALGYEAARNEN